VVLTVLDPGRVIGSRPLIGDLTQNNLDYKENSRGYSPAKRDDNKKGTNEDDIRIDVRLRSS